MTKPVLECYDRAPSALTFMSRAILPSPGLAPDGRFPGMAVRWAGLRIERAQLQAFGHATGISVRDGLPILFPHVFGFRLQMALLTHRRYPLPIWTALQVRNRLVRHASSVPHEDLDMETQVGGHRFAGKGIEVDLVSRLTRGSDCYWESHITYAYRGRFNGNTAVMPATKSPALSGATLVDRFQMPKHGGWNFGRLSGDYNGIHYWPWYARRLGFPTAFLHPQRVAGMCLARLQGPETGAQTLGLWIKGPVFYGAQVRLSAVEDDGGLRFSLSLEGDPRPALVGHWRKGTDS